LGFWVQIVAGAVPLISGAYLLLFNRGTLLPGVGLLGYLAFAGLLILVFTTLWFWRYARLGERLEQGDQGWTRARLTGSSGSA
jgi:hypothetical protein